ncbi:MAG: hypothetical protein QOG09_1457 [Solirubrobacterales bacterium]|jgi:septal ring factor EnvC (AmiA/AmiB activator)|nr:hypothetical protein [Solirubrobacterales bacterium]MDX6663355.1 hypothetical protein [Solirubrobacterales bacterium]
MVSGFVALVALAAALVALVVALGADNKENPASQIDRLNRDLASLRTEARSAANTATAATRTASDLSKPIADTNDQLKALRKKVKRNGDDIVKLQKDFTSLSNRIGKVEQKQSQSSSGGKTGGTGK